MEASDCQEFVRPVAKPLGNYTNLQHAMRKVAVMSNFPAAKKTVLLSCDTPLEMLTELDRLIIPPSAVAEFGHQIQFMNLVHEPACEAVAELRARAKNLVDDVRRCKDSELTDSIIRRNGVSAISGAYPRLYEEAILTPSLTVEVEITREWR